LVEALEPGEATRARQSPYWHSFVPPKAGFFADADQEIGAPGALASISSPELDVIGTH
jgi:hypothetical protein